MRHLRSLSSLGLCVLSIAWTLTGDAVRATTPSATAHLHRPDVELSIREPADESGSLAASPYLALEGPLSPVERRLFADAADSRWDEHTLLTAALVASGVDSPSRLAHYESLVAALVDELRHSAAMQGTEHQQAQAILEFLHQRVLGGGYRLDSSDLTVALDKGRFNCVSASVLFNCFAEDVGLTARGLEIPGHAMSRLVLTDGTLDVETTCPEWFRLMDDPQKQAAVVEKTIGIRYMETTPPAQRREVSAVELVATIYYNRGVDLLAQKRFAEAVAANAKALRLDPANSTARGNLLATLNNWAIDLGSNGRYLEAVATLSRGIALDAAYPTFKTNYVHVHHQWIDALCRQGEYGEAADVLASAEFKKLDEAYFQRARLDLYRRWARTCLQSGQTDDAFEVFAQARRQLGAVSEVRQQEVAEINRQAAALLEEDRAGDAVELLDRALTCCTGATSLLENRRTMVMRWAEPAFQQGDFAEAIRRTTHGSTPGHLDAPLVNNVRYGYYEWISRLLADGQQAEARRIARQAEADPFLAGKTAGAIPAVLDEP